MDSCEKCGHEIYEGICTNWDCSLEDYLLNKPKRYHIDRIAIEEVLGDIIEFPDKNGRYYVADEVDNVMQQLRNQISTYAAIRNRYCIKIMSLKDKI